MDMPSSNYIFSNQHNCQYGLDPQMLLQSQQISGSSTDNGNQLYMSPHSFNNGYYGGHNNNVNVMQNSNRLTIQQQLQEHPLSSAPIQQLSLQQQSNEEEQQQRDQTEKTPVSILHEICSKVKITPVFEFTESGCGHSRVFICLVKVDAQAFVCEATATGKNKKDAKQEAARALLLKMDDQVQELIIPTPSASKEETVSPPQVDAEVSVNSLANLNDLCEKLKCPPPEYETVAVSGNQHGKVYTVACKLGSIIVETGRGRSKRDAKKVAANKVYKRVLEIIVKESNEAGIRMQDEDLNEKLSTLTLMKKEEAKNMSCEWKLNDWVSDLKNRSGPKMDMLKMNKVTFFPSCTFKYDPITLLREIAEEQKFKLDFVTLGQENSESNTCLLAVSAGHQLITTVMGTAESKIQAKMAAAKCFLDMFRLILASK